MHMPSEPVWSWVETPIGDGLIVIGPQGAIRAAFSRPDGTGMPSEESVLIEAGAQLGAAPAHDPAALAEILTLFPELADRDYQPAAARTLASGRLGRKLAVRHGQNAKPLVS